MADKDGTGWIWARDVCIDNDDDDGDGDSATTAPLPTKQYMCTASADEFLFRHLLLTRAVERHFYEIISMEHPCHLYIDADLAWTELNRRVVPDVVDLEQRAFQEFYAFLRETFPEWWQPTTTTTTTTTTACSDDWVVRAYDSSTEEKWSRHYVIELPGGALLRSPAHAGAVIRRFRNHIIRKHGSVRDNKNPFFLWRSEVTEPVYRMYKGGLENKVFIFDQAVYTRERQFRLIGNCKMRQQHANDDGGQIEQFKRYLRPSRIGEYQCAPTRIYSPQSLEQFTDALVRASSSSSERVYDVLEEDGSQPRSSNQTLEGRPDIDGDWRQFVTDDDDDGGRRKRHKRKRLQREDDDGGGGGGAWIDDYPFATVWEHVLMPLRDGELRCMAMRTTEGIWLRAGVVFETHEQWREHARIHRPAIYDIGVIATRRRPELRRNQIRAEHCQPVAREWTIDLDLGERERRTLCTCGDEKRVCAQCWPLAVRSAHFYCYLLQAIADGCGRRYHMSLFFSGGRGVHVWIRPEQAERRAMLCDRRVFFRLFFAEAVVRRQLTTIRSPLYTKCAHKAFGCHVPDMIVPLDENVFTSAAHLCKMPYATHASTGHRASALVFHEQGIDTGEEIPLPFLEGT